MDVCEENKVNHCNLQFITASFIVCVVRMFFYLMTDVKIYESLHKTMSCLLPTLHTRVSFRVAFKMHGPSRTGSMCPRRPCHLERGSLFAREDKQPHHAH